MDDIDFQDDYLVIVEEYQGVCFWGIKQSDLIQDNPKVYTCFNIDNKNPQWWVENDTFEKFFVMMALFNGTMGGLPCCASGFNTNGFDKFSADVSVITTS